MDISQEALDRFERSNQRAKKAVMLTLSGFPLGGLIGFIISLITGGPIDRITAGGALAGFIILMYAGFIWAWRNDK